MTQSFSRVPLLTDVLDRPLDSLVAFSKIQGNLGSASGTAPVRYAVRQVLDQEYRKETLRKQSDVSSSKAAIGKSAAGPGNPTQKAMNVAKRDFFGRVIEEPVKERKDGEEQKLADETSKAGRKVWVTYHEGFSNAVRKPISMSELLAGL